MTTPVERPTIRCLLAWVSRTGDPLASVTVNLLGVEYFLAAGWTFVALDPESVEEWHAWRARNPVAA